MLEADDVRPRGVRTFVVTFALVLACLVTWSVATPMYAAPDEQAHMVKAYAVVHADRGTENDNGERQYDVPPAYTGGDICYAFQSEQPADCQKLADHGPDHLARTTAGAYPPFFYLLVGWPTLFTSGVVGLYLMRIAAAIIVAFLLALALHNVFELRNRGPLLVGVALAMTPAAFFFGSSVNPSGMSIAAALAVWTGGIVLVRSARITDMRLALAKVGGPLCLFLLLRRDSLLWAALIILTIVLLTPRERRDELGRAQGAWFWGVAVASCALLQLTLSGASTVLIAEGGKGNVGHAWNDIPHYLDEIGGGVLGWLDTTLPRFVLVVFTWGTGLLAAAALTVATRRRVYGILGMAVAVVTAPLTIGAVRHPYFQGRYAVPFTIGLALLSGLTLSESPRAKPWFPGVSLVALPLIGVVQIEAFAQTLRRFTSGSHGAWYFSHPPAWQPPVFTATTLTTLYAAAIVGLLAWILVQTFADWQLPKSPRAPKVRHAPPELRVAGVPDVWETADLPWEVQKLPVEVSQHE